MILAIQFLHAFHLHLKVPTPLRLVLRWLEQNRSLSFARFYRLLESARHVLATPSTELD